MAIRARKSLPAKSKWLFLKKNHMLPHEVLHGNRLGGLPKTVPGEKTFHHSSLSCLASLPRPLKDCLTTHPSTQAVISSKARNR